MTRPTSGVAVPRFSSGGGGPAPEFATGAIIRVMADAGIAVADGQPIDTWTDQSGNGNNLTAVTTARPTYRAADAFDGMPRVEFDGTGNVFVLSRAYAGLDYTMLMVARISSSGSNLGLLSTNNSGGGNDFGTVGHFTLVTKASNGGVQTVASEPINAMDVADNGLQNRWAIIGLRRRSSTTEGAGFHSLISHNRILSVASISNTAFAYNRTALFSRLEMSVTPSGFVRGWLREFAIWERCLTDDELESTMQFLRDKWKLANV